MKNVPWHEQVIEFCSNLADNLENYSIACEHEHSNCVLLAHHRFKNEHGWNTWIGGCELTNYLVPRLLLS